MSEATTQNDEEDKNIHRAVSNDGTEIVGRIHGEGPPLVLVPGAMSDGEFVWDPLLPLLIDRFTCYAMSTRSRGLSGKSSDLSPSRRIQDVVAYIESIGDAVGLIGWSGGGMIALGAAENTNAVSAIALYEPAVFEAISDTVYARFMDKIERMGELAAENRLVDAAHTFIDLVANDDEVSDSEALGFFDGWASNVPVFLQEIQQLFDGEGPGPTNPSELAKISIPVLLLHGSRSIPETWFSDGVRHVSGHVADPQVSEITGAGHMGPSHEPKVVAAELMKFFETVFEPA